MLFSMTLTVKWLSINISAHFFSPQHFVAFHPIWAQESLPSVFTVWNLVPLFVSSSHTFWTSFVCFILELVQIYALFWLIYSIGSAWFLSSNGFVFLIKLSKFWTLFFFAQLAGILKTEPPKPVSFRNVKFGKLSWVEPQKKSHGVYAILVWSGNYGLVKPGTHTHIILYCIYIYNFK